MNSIVGLDGLILLIKLSNIQKLQLLIKNQLFVDGVYKKRVEEK